MNPYVGATLYKGFFRIIGTFFGAFLGVLFANFDLSNIASYLFIIFIMIFITQYCVAVTRYPYAFLLGGVTFLFVFGSMVLGPDQPSLTAGWRSTEITLGVICASLTALVIFPKDAMAQMTSHLQKALQQCQYLLQKMHHKEQNPIAITFETLENQINTIKQHLPLLKDELGVSHYQNDDH